MLKTFAKTLGTVSIFLFLPLAISGGIPMGALAADTIKIAQIDPHSGPFEQTGRVYGAGLRFAVAEQNAKGGLLGKKIEVLQADSEMKPEVMTRKAKKFILEDKVNFLTGGGSGTHGSIALGNVAKAYKTIHINYGGMSDFIQGKEFDRYSFRVCQNSHNLTSALAQLMASTPYQKYYIICQDYSWGYDVAKAFKEQMKIYKPDAQFVGEDYHPIATKDFGPYITKVVKAEADAIFTGNWASDARLLVKQARQLGLKSPFPMVMIFGVDPYIENELQDASVGIHWAYDYTVRVETPENAEFIKRYREVIGKNEKDFMTWWPVWSTGTSAIGWMMTFAAVEKAGSLDPEKIIDAFEGMWYKSPVGWKHMRKCDHQIIGPMFGGKVEAGWNPWFNGSIDPKIKFPWLGKVKMFPATESALPPTSDYNKRCP